MKRPFIFLLVASLCRGVACLGQSLPADAALTVRPQLQQLGQRLLKGKTGSIVAIRPETGEIICLTTNGPQGEDVSQAIARPQAPGSTFKTAQALTLLTEGVVTEDMQVECDGGFLDGNIRVGCHRHRSPLALVDALAHSCNTWFLETFMQMVSDRFMYETQEEAVDTWNGYMRSFGLGAPLIIDLPGEKGGLLANVGYLNRRYPQGWDAKTIMWAGMGQGDVTVTPLQLCNLAVTIANRGWYYVPHIYKDTPQHPLRQRFKERRTTKASAEAYQTVVKGMRQAVVKGTCASINASYPICGKTGTIENPGKDHSAFIGFAPMDAPVIAISVYVEHGGFGADMAAPIASLIIEAYLRGQLSAKSETLARQLEAKHTN